MKFAWLGTPGWDGTEGVRVYSANRHLPEWATEMACCLPQLPRGRARLQAWCWHHGLSCLGPRPTFGGSVAPLCGALILFFMPLCPALPSVGGLVVLSLGGALCMAGPPMPAQGPAERPLLLSVMGAGVRPSGHGTWDLHHALQEILRVHGLQTGCPSLALTCAAFVWTSPSTAAPRSCLPLHVSVLCCAACSMPSSTAVRVTARFLALWRFASVCARVCVWWPTRVRIAPALGRRFQVERP